jgi:hypothetical protein
MAYGLAAGELYSLDNAVIPLETRAYASAYDRFYAKVRSNEQAALAMTFATLDDSLVMVAKRARQIASVVRQVRRGNIGNAVHILRSVPPPPGFKPRKWKKATWQDSFLELYWGWGPLIDDFRTSVRVIANQSFESKIRSSCTLSASDLVSTVISPQTVTNSYGVKTRIGISATVVYDDSNLFLANQLGLANPLNAVWDAVPFSFLLDTILPVGKFLNSLSNDFGVSLKDVCLTSKRTAYSDRTIVDPRYVSQIGTDRTFSGGSAVCFNRVPMGALKLPSLYSRSKLPTASLGFAVAMTALLTQSLRKQ